jgi:hypothetical protein
MHHDEELYDHGAFTKGKKPKGDSVVKDAAPFSDGKVVMSIYGGPAPHKYRRKLKLMSQVINAVSPATPKYLRWSESPITFDQMDHPDSIPKLGRFPLILHPLVRMGQWSQPHVPRDLILAGAYPRSAPKQPTSVLRSGPEQAVHPPRVGHPTNHL